MRKIIFRMILLINILFVYMSYLNGKTFYDDRIKNNKTTPKIYDIGHKYLPDYSYYNETHVLMNIFVFLPLLFNLSLFSDYLSYLLPVLMFRYITINSTILPKSKTCDDSDFGILHILHGHCYDKLFSGHMASSIITSLLLYKKNIVTNLKLLSIYNLTSAFLILVTRSHYTVDILFGTYVALTSFFLDINVDLLKNIF
jgi:hypothetical protein